MGLVILNHPRIRNIKFLKETIRYCGYLLGRRRGPFMVTQALIKGLGQLRYPFFYNPPLSDIHPDDTIYVNESVGALLYALSLKRARKIKSLWAGPAITVLPDEENGLMRHPLIDGLLFPAGWPKDVWVAQYPEMESKIHVWAAGVDPPLLPMATEKKEWLIFQKNAPTALFEFICTFLNKQGVMIRIIRYGSFSYQEYCRYLSSAQGLIYLSESESQGLALFEAWAYDVPTLVWNRGYWSYGSSRWYDKKISAPYLVPACGDFFSDTENFASIWKLYTEKSRFVFSPRTYILQNFTCKKSAKRFLDILNINQ